MEAPLDILHSTDFMLDNFAGFHILIFSSNEMLECLILLDLVRTSFPWSLSSELYLIEYLCHIMNSFFSIKVKFNTDSIPSIMLNNFDLFNVLVSCIINHLILQIHHKSVQASRLKIGHFNTCFWVFTIYLQITCNIKT